MARCPDCGYQDAYIGFNSVECVNQKCKHFVINSKAICPCCGLEGHKKAFCPKLIHDTFQKALQQNKDLGYFI